MEQEDWNRPRNYWGILTTEASRFTGVFEKRELGCWQDFLQDILTLKDFSIKFIKDHIRCSLQILWGGELYQLRSASISLKDELFLDHWFYNQNQWIHSLRLLDFLWGLRVSLGQRKRIRSSGHSNHIKNLIIETDKIKSDSAFCSSTKVSPRLG